MGRKRRAPTKKNIKDSEDEEKENEEESTEINQGPMYSIMSNVQLSETFHVRYIKDLKQLYAKMDHDAFMFTFIKMIKTAMEADDGNEFAQNTLNYCAKFVGSFDIEDTHPVLLDTFKWLLETISNNPHIRYRLCQFVNLILNALGLEAALDDHICDAILSYMLERLRDVSPNVREQAILAMQRLQLPDNPDDPVLRAYQFHLCSDPSPRVRMAVIICMGRNFHTIPYILERLWDIDAKVRRHTYLHMSSYPVRAYKVTQRLTLLQQGLNDRSEQVRKVVTSVMLQQWIESYQKNFVALISALKRDNTEDEMLRFRKITKQMLNAIFKREKKDVLVGCLNLPEDCEFHRCVPHEQLTIESAFYWQCLAEYLQNEMAEELDHILPELSTFCAYVWRFCETRREITDPIENIEFQYTLLSLMEILYIFDLGDEIGRNNLKKLLEDLLINVQLDSKVIHMIIKCGENLMTDQLERMHFFKDIIENICGLTASHNELLQNRNLMDELLNMSTDANLKLKLSTIKVKILDLEEQKNDLLQRKEYIKAHEITVEKNALTEEYVNLLKPLLEQQNAAENADKSTVIQLPKILKNDEALKCLKITYYMIVSPKVVTLDPSVCKLYHNFICLHMGSNQISIRDWALKCGTAYSMLYDTLAKDVYGQLFLQFYENHSVIIWSTSISCIFELLDKYGLNYFDEEDQNQVKTKKGGRVLYNTLEFLDLSENISDISASNRGVNVICMMTHLIDSCEDVCIIAAIVKGFCRLVLRGLLKTSEIIEKLLLRYFDPATNAHVSQILGVFMENLIKRRKHDLLQPCLLPTVFAILGASYDSPLHEIRPDTITRFVIDTTRPSSGITSPIIHEQIAKSFLEEMINNSNNKDLCKLLAKEIVTLELNLAKNPDLKNKIKDMAKHVLNLDFDTKTKKYIENFQDMVEGIAIAVPAEQNENEAENDSDDETVNTEKSTDIRDPQATNVTLKKAIPTTTDESQNSLADTASEIEIVNNNSQSSNDTTLNANDETIVEANKTLTNKTTLSPEVLRTPNPASKKNVAETTLSQTPTTFGIGNQAIHCSLRKSLNATRREEIGSDSGAGPKRICIEIRLDSDKKSPDKNPQKSNKTGEEQVNAKKSLQYDNNDKNDKNEKADNDDNNKESSKSKSPTGAAGHLPSIIVTTELNENAAEKQKQKKQQQKTVAEVNTRKTPRTRRGVARLQQNQQESEKSTHKHKDDDDDDDDDTNESETASSQDTISLSSSDIVPPSPTATPSQRALSGRLRRAVLVEQSTSLRSTRSNSKKENSTKSTKTNKQASAPTPLRNGRKRVFRKSPNHAAALADNYNMPSPLRKQQRTDDVTKPRQGQEKSTIKTATQINDTEIVETETSKTSPHSKNADSAEVTATLKSPQQKINSTTVKTIEKPTTLRKNAAKSSKPVVNVESTTESDTSSITSPPRKQNKSDKTENVNRKANKNVTPWNENNKRLHKSAGKSDSDSSTFASPLRKQLRNNVATSVQLPAGSRDMRKKSASPRTVVANEKSKTSHEATANERPKTPCETAKGKFKSPNKTQSNINVNQLHHMITRSRSPTPTRTRTPKPTTETNAKTKSMQNNVTEKSKIPVRFGTRRTAAKLITSATSTTSGMTTTSATSTTSTTLNTKLPTRIPFKQPIKQTTGKVIAEKKQTAAKSTLLTSKPTTNKEPPKQQQRSLSEIRARKSTESATADDTKPNNSPSKSKISIQATISSSSSKSTSGRQNQSKNDMVVQTNPNANDSLNLNANRILKKRNSVPIIAMRNKSAFIVVSPLNNSISTRKTARLERQFQSIMTRKRLSLESAQKCSSSTLLNELQIVLVQKPTPTKSSSSSNNKNNNASDKTITPNSSSSTVDMHGRRSNTAVQKFPSGGAGAGGGASELNLDPSRKRGRPRLK